ncbi:MAG: folate family ECF transporter S component [Oscillospiraceae bacterium]|nr:folate family ECF transporter S component [Oscillospiraceae bacterium]
MFRKSFNELKSLRTLVIVAMLLAVGFVLESFTIQITQILRISFAFLPMAGIGMLFGPVVGLLAGFVGDIIFYFANPIGGFQPLYILLGGLQGFIYGSVLYYKNFQLSRFEYKSVQLHSRAVVARLLDIVFVNLLGNTAALIHYKWIVEDTFAAAVATRVAKNAIELFADVPLLLAILPALLLAYNRNFSKKEI